MNEQNDLPSSTTRNDESKKSGVPMLQGTHVNQRVQETHWKNQQKQSKG